MLSWLCHPCTVCTTGACENKADCKFAECSTCRSNDCLYVTFQCFTYMVYALRNVHSHCEHEFFVAFEAGKIIIFSNIRHSTNQYKLFQKKEIVKDINFWSWSSEFSVNFAITLRKSSTFFHWTGFSNSRFPLNFWHGMLIQTDINKNISFVVDYLKVEKYSKTFQNQIHGTTYGKSLMKKV